MKKLLFALLLPALAIAQTTDVRPVPNCIVQFTASAVGVGTTFDNRAGCTYWTVVYSSIGFSALSLAVEAAPGANVAGTWVTFAGTVDTGVNPNTAITQASATMHGFYPWMRLNLTAATGTGTVRAQLYGYKLPPATSGGGGAFPNPIMVVGPDADGAPSASAPVQVAGVDVSGNVQQVRVDAFGRPVAIKSTQAGTLLYPCTNSAAINLTASGNTQIIAASGSTAIHICHISLAATSSVNLQLVTGTGANCATGAANLTGVYIGTLGFALDFGDWAQLTGGASQALCLNQSAAVVTGGVILYAQY